MTQEELKDLLIKDICARLPYGIICDDGYGNVLELNGIDNPNTATFKCSDKTFGTTDLDKCKPYLFPLSTMTDEQKEELFKLCEFYIQEDWEGKKSEAYGIEIARRPDPAYCYDHTFRIWGIDMRAIDWFLKNHFDINNLIPRELALDATGLNIY